ncbi:MAG TPA: 3'-5' exonuclease [Alphaproteobacteria bacterium]|nr:3'-5' exonuclease [Alphaproteobacteria bacterium]
MQPRKLLVFDLETVPDLDLARKLWEDVPADDTAARDHVLNVFRERNGGRSDFPSPAFHKIVAIGCLLADIEPMEGGRAESYHFKKLGCIGKDGDTEADLVRQWYDYAAQQAGHGVPLRLVSFNGRGFDLPVLKLRALKHGVNAAWLFQSGDKWSNYGSRFDNTWHADLADVLADYGAARGGMKLDEVCTLIGLPGKLDIEGSKVADMVAEGRLNDVRDYCETDILNTYLLYLRWQRLSGILSPEALTKEEDALREFLAREGKGAKHLKSFAEAWPQPEA